MPKLKIHPLICLLLLVTMIAGMVYTSFSTNIIINTLIYAFSFLALIIIVIKIPDCYKSLKIFVQSNRYAALLVKDGHLRFQISLTASFIINIAYSILQLFLGLYNQSFWYIFLFAYYLILSWMRFSLLKNINFTDLKKALKKYLNCGRFLLVLNFVLTFMILFMISSTDKYRHHKIITISIATYTFYALTMAIINIIRYRKSNNPVLKSAKCISFCCAMVSVLSLETTMLNVFGQSGQEMFRKYMIQASGLVVVLIIIYVSVYMIKDASRKLRSR